MASETGLKKTEAELRRFALTYPEAYEDTPWGERVVKVNKRVFVFFHVPSDALHVTVKLPESAGMALGLPFATPTGYGLGKSGWITATFEAGSRAPVAVLKQWIDESYRAVAPKTLVRRLDGAGGPAASRGRSPRAAAAPPRPRTRR